MSEITSALEAGLNLGAYRDRQVTLAAEYVTAVAAANLGHKKFSILREGQMMLGLTADDYVLGVNRAYDDPRLKYTVTGFAPAGEDIELSVREQKILGLVSKLIEHEDAKVADCGPLIDEIHAFGE